MSETDPPAPGVPAPETPPPAPAPESSTPEDSQPPKVISPAEHKKTQRECQNLRTRLRASETARQEAEAKVELSRDTDAEVRLQEAIHRAKGAETVAEANVLHPRAALLLLLEATEINQDGRLVLRDGGEEVDAEVARQILPPAILRSAGGPGSGGSTPNPLKTPTSRTADERMLYSQASFEKLTPEERAAAERRLRGPK